MENIDNTQNEEDNQNSSNKRSRRTPSKFGNYFEFEEVVEEEEKEEADEDDSDEDPSWDDKKGGKNSFSKGYVPPEEDDDDDDQDFSDADEDDDNSKRKKGRGRGRGSMVNIRGRGRGAIPNSGVILNNARGISYGGPPQSAQAPSHAKPLPPTLSTIPPHLLSQMRPIIGQQNTGMGMSGMSMGQQSGGPIIHDSRIASIQRDSALQQIFNAQQQQQKVQQVQQNSMNWRGYPISVTNGPSMPNLSASPSSIGQQQSTQQQQQQQQMGQYRSMTPEQQMKMQNDIRYQEMYRQQQQQQQQQQQAKQQDQMRSQQQMMQQYQTSSNSSTSSNSTTPASSSSFDPSSILSNSAYSRNYYGSNSADTTSPTNTSPTTSISSGNNTTAPGSNFVPFKLPQFGNPASSTSSIGSELYRQPSPQPQPSTTNSTSTNPTTSPTLNYSKVTGQTSSPPLLSSSANSAQNSSGAPKSGIFDSLFSQWNQSGLSSSGSNNSTSSSNNRMNPLRFSNDPLATINSFFSDEETSGLDISSSTQSNNTSNSTTSTSNTSTSNSMDTNKSGYGTSSNSPLISFPTTTSGIPPSYLTNYTGPSNTPSSASSLLSNNRGVGYPPSIGGTSTNSYNNIPSSINNYSRYPNVPNTPNTPGFLYSYGNNNNASNAMRNPALSQQQPQQQQQGGWGQMNNPNLMRSPQFPQQQQQDLYQRNLAYRPPIIPGYPGPMSLSGIPPEHLIQDKDEEQEEDEEEEEEDEDPDVDPQEKKLNTLVKQCEQYATQIRDVVGHWQEKSLGNDKEMKGSILEENPEEVQNLELIKQPEMLVHELRSYQLVGLNWLYLLHQQKINGILADEMGLGKTIQTISFFALLKEKADMKKPHVVIVPATALENWVREFAEWCPSFKVEMYHGSAKDRESLRKKLLPKDGKYEFDVLITTYNLCVNKVDRVKFFKKFDFGYIVLDEAHNIKNVSSLRYQSLVKLAFRAEFRLMLTGTPLQNNLNELWALLNFLMPNIFGDTKEFKDLLWPEDDEHNNENNIEVQRLKRILSPFLLRRLKSEVLTKLPQKTEKLVWCGFTPFQRELYEKTYQSSRTKYHNYAIKAEENREFRERREKGNNSDDDDLEVINEQATSFKSEGKEPLEEKTLHHILMQLRKAANNALLFRHYYDDDKIDKITQILREEELNKAAKSEEENALLNKKRKLANEENNSKKVKTENGGEEEHIEEEEEEEEDSETTKTVEQGEEGTNPLTTTNGEECGVCGEIGNLLLCDGPCIRGFHLQCIGLESQPDSDKWYCDDCDYLVKDSTLLDAPATEFQDKFVSIIEAVENCQDKKGRYKSELFIYLPAKREYPDYYEIIKTPISLHMLKRRHYQSREHFRDEFYQLVKNAHTYNTPNSQVYRDASSLEKIFRKEFTKYFGSELLPPPTTTTTTSRSSTTSTAHSTMDTFDYSELELEALFEDIDEEEDDDDDDDKPTKKRKKTSSSSRSKKNIDNEDLESYGVETSSSVPSVSRRTRSRRGQSSSTSEDFPMALLEDTTTRRKSSRNASSASSSTSKSNNKNKNSGGNNSSAIRKAKLNEPFLTCRNILEDLMDQDDAIPFNTPVDEATTPDYYKIVKNPMDFASVWSKLNRKEYSSPDEFIDDVRLVFDNCLLYNAPSSQIGLVAQQLWSFFKRQCKKQGIKVDSNVILLHKKMKSEDLSTLPEELKLKSDMEIHQFCKSYDSLKHLCLPDDQLFHSSGKLEALKKKLLKFHTKQNRVLIFSQFTQILNILEDFLARLGFKFLRLDGSTPVLERQLMIDDFNHNRDIFVFLLSTRAGGLGINLTSADVCVFHDIDWNPEMDRQAEARIHRIGQMKPVKIVKLLTKDTVDEYIYRMAQNKKERNDLIMSENDKVITEEKLSIAQVLSSIFTQPETAKVEPILITEPKTE